MTYVSLASACPTTAEIDRARPRSQVTEPPASSRTMAGPSHSAPSGTTLPSVTNRPLPVTWSSWTGTRPASRLSVVHAGVSTSAA